MTAAALSGGGAKALTRRLYRSPDPLALYAALSDRGRRSDTMLVETLAGPTLIMDQAALRIECRGQEVHLAALTASGALLLRTLAKCFAHFVAGESGGAERRLVLRFPRPCGDDAEARLLAASPFDVLRALSTGMRSDTPEEPFTLALLGTVAFDHVDLFEDLPAPAEDALGFPDFVFWLAESLIVFEQGLAPRLVCTAFASDDAAESTRAHFSAADRLAALAERCERPLDEVGPAAPSDPAVAETDLDDAAYGAVVARMKAHILAGDVYQIVPSRTFRAPCADPIAAFAAVRRLDRSPYMFFMAAPDHLLFGASPETSVRITREDKWPMVEVKPIAGTRPRGGDADEDDRMEADLRLDQKEIAEHMMLVDLARNDVARVSIPGTRRVAKLMTVERYARVMHLVSSVKGALAIGYDALHALQACLNVGTLSGAPKLKATELLRRTERTKRGPYGGALGWLNGEGLMDTGVVIRSAVVRDGIAYVRAGAGVVHDSDPQKEADETRRKASAILSALGAPETKL
ncbi:anthranilate synthase component 1 [Sphingomonas parva]|uniref:anthranilate synthase component 1 n=1 Tax=Sphingomonas parva TaxID=2555898 RepID=UPI00142FBCFC|nr:anthranilate synthase component 1 [Sphingomonas parva]